jgi:hypothetical protein
VILGVAVVAVLVAWRLSATRLQRTAVVWWLASAFVFCAGIASFNTLIYGGPLRSGYRPGEVTFSLSAVGANLRSMPTHLIQAMPMLGLGLAALAGIVLVWLHARRAGGERSATARRGLAVGLALVASWAAIWGLYPSYAWTTAPRMSTLQSARFYVPALGAIALLGAWLLVRVPRKRPLVALTTVAICATLFWLGTWAFHDLYQSPYVGIHLRQADCPGPIPSPLVFQNRCWSMTQ